MPAVSASYEIPRKPVPEPCQEMALEWSYGITKSLCAMVPDGAMLNTDLSKQKGALGDSGKTTTTSAMVAMSTGACKMHSICPSLHMKFNIPCEEIFNNAISEMLFISSADEQTHDISKVDLWQRFALHSQHASLRLLKAVTSEDCVDQSDLLHCRERIVAALLRSH